MFKVYHIGILQLNNNFLAYQIFLFEHFL